MMHVSGARIEIDQTTHQPSECQADGTVYIYMTWSRSRAYDADLSALSCLFTDMVLLLSRTRLVVSIRSAVP